MKSANRLASRLFLEGDMPIKNADTSLTGLFASILQFTGSWR